jgi:hypothetical protein
MKFDIESIFEQFDVDGSFERSSPIKSGHINDTFLVVTDIEASYILQRLNHEVFDDPAAVVENKVLVSENLRRKLIEQNIDDVDNRVLTFFKTAGGEFVYSDADGNSWNLMLYVNDSHVFLKTPDTRTANEAGKAFGSFLALTSDIDPSEVKETLPRFHSMSMRLRQFDEARMTAEPSRINNDSFSCYS